MEQENESIACEGARCLSGITILNRGSHTATWTWTFMNRGMHLGFRFDLERKLLFTSIKPNHMNNFENGISNASTNVVYLLFKDVFMAHK
jgi:hypothetical protein